MIIHDKDAHIEFLNRTIGERDDEIRRLRTEVVAGLSVEVERLRGEQKLDGAEIEKLQRELGNLRDGLSITSTQEQNAACDAQHFEREVERLLVVETDLTKNVERLRKELARENAECGELTRNLFESRDLAVKERDAAYDESSKLRDEVERLRAETAEALGYLSRLFTAYAPQCTPLRTLSGVCTQIDNMLTALRDVDKLKAENAELRERVAFLGEEPLPLSAQELAELDWFRRREQYVRKLAEVCVSEFSDIEHDTKHANALLVWEKANPKPGAGT